MPKAETTPDDLLHELRFGLMQQRARLVRLGKLPKHDTADDLFTEIARDLVAHLKRSGIEKIIRRHAVAHSMLKSS